MKILVTGGNGFIARNLKEQLSDEHDVIAPTRQELDLLDIDAVDRFTRSCPPDVVIHTATYDAVPSHYNKDPNKVLENNLRMFFNLERFIHRYDMINLGSGAEYSRPYWLPRMNESYFGAHIPEDPYGLSKYISAKLAESRNGDGSNLVHLRLFAVFGKYEDWRVRFLSKSICRNIFGLPIKINQNRVFDFLFIDDLVRIIRWMLRDLDRVNYSVINVCSGTTHRFLELADKIHTIGGRHTGNLILSPGMGSEYSGNNDLLTEVLRNIDSSYKFIPTPIDQSLGQLYQWYAERKDTIDPDLL